MLPGNPKYAAKNHPWGWFFGKEDFYAGLV
jgi:hypothetical protein